MSSSAQALSGQDLEDLRQIRSGLPSGDPRIDKIDTLVGQSSPDPSQMGAGHEVAPAFTTGNNPITDRTGPSGERLGGGRANSPEQRAAQLDTENKVGGRVVNGMYTALSLGVPGAELADAAQAGRLVPTAIKLGRGLVAGGLGAAGGRYAGGGIGGMFGDTGKKIGEGVGSVVGGLAGGMEGYKFKPPEVDPLDSAIDQGIASRIPTKMPKTAAPADELTRAVKEGLAARLPLRLNAPKETPQVDPLIQAIREGRASRIPTRMPRQLEVPQIAMPSEGEPRMTGSEGRPATWTNEDVLRLAQQGNREAIQQLTRRGIELPPNARYIMGDQDYPRGVYNPRETTKFAPSGTPIRNKATLPVSLKNRIAQP